MPDWPKRIHLLGIGGVGMGALAGLFHAAGAEVTGSEGAPVYPPMSLLLEELKIPVFIGYGPENLDQARPDLVIIGNVIRRDNPEAKEVLSCRLPYLSLPEALNRFFIAKHKSLVVAGTHGKTTTSALLAYGLEQLGQNPTFLIGGLLRDRGRNFALGKGPYVVLEGDEYDSAFFDKRAKFLHYAPFGAILTSVEFDHADIYPHFEALKETFSHFVSLIPKEGLLVYAVDDPGAREVASKASCRKISYGLSQKADIRLLKRFPSPSGQRIDFIFRDRLYTFSLPLIGLHNALNALAVWGLLQGLDFTPEAIARAIQDFPGTKRRQELLIDQPVVVIDDFAHHPTAVKVTIEAVREAFSPKRLIVCFEPRTNTSRRKIFQKDYAKTLALADLVLLKEPPNLEKVPKEERLSLRELVKDLETLGTKALAFAQAEGLFAELKKEICPEDLVLFMSNGPFDHLPQRLVQFFQKFSLKPPKH